MTDLLAIGKQTLAAQPFSRLLGAELMEFSAERIEIVVPIKEQTKQQNGFVHGGVISYAADNALTFAGGATLGAAVVASEYKKLFETGCRYSARCESLGYSRRQKSSCLSLRRFRRR